MTPEQTRHSKQTGIPAHTVPFPAALLDAAMPRLTDTEWRLLCVVVRQTLGWHDPATGGRRQRDWLTQRQLMARTGRSSRPLARATQRLVDKGLIQVEAADGCVLATPASRRRHPGSHWFRLGPRLLASTPRMTAPPTGERTHVPAEDQATDVLPALLPEEAYVRWAASKGHTTKESRNKRNVKRVTTSRAKSTYAGDRHRTVPPPAQSLPLGRVLSVPGPSERIILEQARWQVPSGELPGEADKGHPHNPARHWAWRKDSAQWVCTHGEAQPEEAEAAQEAHQPSLPP